jgi:hypothetical protein
MDIPELNVKPSSSHVGARTRVRTPLMLLALVVACAVSCNESSASEQSDGANLVRRLTQWLQVISPLAQEAIDPPGCALRVKRTHPAMGEWTDGKIPQRFARIEWDVELFDSAVDVVERPSSEQLAPNDSPEEKVLEFSAKVTNAAGEVRACRYTLIQRGRTDSSLGCTITNIRPASFGYLGGEVSYLVTPNPPPSGEAPYTGGGEKYWYIGKNSETKPKDRTLRGCVSNSRGEMACCEATIPQGARVIPSWCTEGDTTPQNQPDVDRCWNDPRVAELRACLENVVRNRRQTVNWPTQEQMTACGCKESGRDESTTFRGRSLYSCADGAVNVSPTPRSLGIMFTGTNGIDRTGCMFDLANALSANVRDPKPALDPVGDPPRENCFACHDRSEPQNVEPLPCPGVPLLEEFAE